MARSLIKLPRFGHFTSNISESCNNALGELRSKSDLDLIVGIYNYIMEKFYFRKTEAEKMKTVFTPYCTSFLKLNQAVSSHYIVKNSTKRKAVIEKTVTEKGEKKKTAKQYLVDLDNYHCSCGFTNDRLIPCHHMSKLLGSLVEFESNFVSDCYKSETQRMIYSDGVPPFLSSYLSSDCTTLPPIIRPKKGRPCTKRKQSYLERMTKMMQRNDFTDSKTN